MINIDDLTLSQIKQLATLASALNLQLQQQNDDFVGKYVICRCYSAGVHAGELVSQQGDVVVLKDSRRLWSWTTNKGIALSGVAQHGINKEKSKIDEINPLIKLTGVIETIPTTLKAQESINGY